MQRKHSVFISKTACISQRNGVLKFFFRVVRTFHVYGLHDNARRRHYPHFRMDITEQADIRERHVLDPKVMAVIYKWRERFTQEGEPVPMRVEPLELNYVEEISILPVYAR